MVASFVVPSLAWVVWSEPKLLLFVLGCCMWLSPILANYASDLVTFFRLRNHRVRLSESGVTMMDGDDERWSILWSRIERIERRPWLPAEFGISYLVDVEGRRFELGIPWRDELRPLETGKAFWEELERRVGAPPTIRSWLLVPTRRRAKVLMGLGGLLVLCGFAIPAALGWPLSADREITLEEDIWSHAAEGIATFGILLVLLGWACWPRRKSGDPPTSEPPKD